MHLNWNQHPYTEGTMVITTIDAHAAGEPLRVITGGLPELQGETILERRRYMRDHLDHIRRALMWEPRGHFNMYGCVVTPPVTPGADLGVLFMHNEGYSTMCGHGIIGQVTVDIAFGGAFYAILPAEHVGLSVTPQQVEQLVTAGEAIKKAVSATLPVKHPFEEDLSFLYGTILTGPPEDPAHHSRNICVFASAEVDRSPTGTGVSARLALHYAKGEIAAGQEIIIESILGAASAFSGRV